MFAELGKGAAELCWCEAEEDDFVSCYGFSQLPLSPPPPSRCFLPRSTSAAPAAAPCAHNHQLRSVARSHVLRLAETGEPDAASSGGGEGTEEGPVLLPPPPPSPSYSSIFATSDDPSPLQVATSVLLTGAISVFLFRSLRRRAKRTKEMRVRSSGVTKAKDVKAEAVESLKAMGSASIQPGAPPSPVQALLGGIAAGVMAVILYKFTTTIEAALNRQTISDNFSVRQITITIRTIVNGLCYLATFVFGVNAIGLVLYSVQLAISSLMEPPTSTSTSGQKEEKTDAVRRAEISSDNVDSKSTSTQQRSDDT